MAAIYTFKDLQDEVLANLDETGDTGTTLTLVKSFLNQAQQARLSAENWPFLRWGSSETLTLTVGTRFYPLHPEFWRPEFFFNQGSKEYLHLVVDRQLSASGARWNTDSQRANLYRKSGWSPVAAQPSSASLLTFASTSGADSGASKALTITGVVSGAVRSETINPAGLTPAITTLSFTKILRVTLTAAWAGTLTLTSNSGAVTNLTLSPGELGRTYPQIELLASPTTADVIEYAFYRQPQKMTADNDLPELPPPHSQLLVWDTLLLFPGYITDISPGSVAAWKDMQGKMERALSADYMEGDEVDAQPRLIRNMEDDGWNGIPRVYFNS